MMTRGSRNLINSALVFAALVLGSLPVSNGVAAEARDPFKYFFYQSFGDLQEELKTARAEGKMGLFVMFDDPECPWCHRMKATVLNQVVVQELYRKYFRPIRVDTTGDTPLTDFAGNDMTEKDFAFKIHRVRATPEFAFFDLNGKKIFRYVGRTRGVAEFLWLAEFVAEGHYKTKKFTAYKREKRTAFRNNP